MAESPDAGAGARDHRPGRRWASGPTTCSSAPAPGTGCCEVLPAGAQPGRRRHPGRHRRRRRPRRRARRSSIGDGEEAKRLATVEDLCRAFARWGLTRGDVVVAVGGGVVTDVAGFAAAVYHRGVAVVHVPTTLLGQVDAAIGGKTGVNLPEGKNLVGAFWQPAAVLCDTEVLSAPCRPGSTAAGSASWPSTTSSAPTTCSTCPLDEAVAACVRSRPTCRRRRARGAARRAILNYGHTLAHALETAGALRPAPRRGGGHRPGLRRRAGPPPRRIDDARVAEHRPRSAGYDLPLRLPARRRPDRAGRPHGPGQEGGRRPDLRARRARTASRSSPASSRRRRRCSHAPMEATVPVTPAARAPAARAQPQPAGRAGARDLRHRHARRPRRPRSRPSRRAPASTLEHLQSNHEGELVDAIHGARGRARGHRHQRRRLHPLRLVAPRRPGRLRRPGRRAAPLQPRRPGAVAPHVGRSPVATGIICGLRRRRLPAWPSTPWELLAD